uniref:CD2 associated protein n=1 Tax=Leptobrachium leishanense TaxID=445787 RepID=A0A8C5PD68_9ANUR
MRIKFEYIVEYDYDAVHEDEISLRVGDVIRNVKRLEEEGWLEGEINGKRGAFPDNFVKEIKKDAEPKDDHVPTKREKPGNVASLVQRMSVYGIPGMGPPHQAKPLKRRSKKRQCKVLFEYIPQNEDELELKVGYIVDVTEEVEEGWWSGTHGGQSGLFPSNFVKEVDHVDDEVVDITEETVEPAAGSASPASPAPPSGNGLEANLSPIAQPKKVMGVGFGDIFKEGSVKLKPRISNVEPDGKKLEKPPPIPSSGPKLSYTPSSEFIKTETDSKPKAKETCRAMYAYDGVNDDELSFKEGDVIHLVSKDTGDPGWWKGELNGKEGVFPDNFAVLISESEKEVSFVIKWAPKPELRGSERRFTPPKPEEKDEKPLLDFKPSKPAAPQVPPKKPLLVNKSNSMLKPGSIPPKRPEKPALPTPTSNLSRASPDMAFIGVSDRSRCVLVSRYNVTLLFLRYRPNGDLPLNRPKSDLEPFSKTKMDLEHILSRPKSADAETCVVKSPRETPRENGDVCCAPLIPCNCFDEVLPTSENLTHPTASRPKMAGKRPPGRFNGVQSVSNTAPVSVSTPPAFTSAPSVTTPTSSLARLSNPLTPIPPPSPVTLTPAPTDTKTKGDVWDGKKGEVDELKTQVCELLIIVDALRKEHRNELEKIKKDLEEEKHLRLCLQASVLHKHTPLIHFETLLRG